MTEALSVAGWHRPSPHIRAEAHYGDRVVGCFADRPASLGQLLDAAIEHWPDRAAITDEERTLTYAELGREADAVAGGLYEQGVRPGDRIVVMLGNSAEFFVALCAALRLGAIIVPVNVREQAAELGRTLVHCQAKAVLVEADLAERLPPAGSGRPAVCVAVRGEVDGAQSYGRLLASQARVATPETSEEDVAVILYTSGTTGLPKGAMLTHLSLTTAAMNYALAAGLDEHDCAAVPAPMSHVTGLTGGLLAMLLVGGRTLSFREFKATPFLQRIASERASFMVMVPAMYALCLLQPDMETLDLSAWRVGGYGGAPMASSLIETLAERLPQLRLINSYGSTETSGPQVLGRPETALQKADCIGLPAPGVEMLIMNEQGKASPPGEIGEIWLRSASVSCGYWNDPKATAAEFVSGFWRSGDLGYVDADGYLKLLDRKKDMINRGGYKIYSAEVENVLLAYPGVVEAAAVPYPCPVLGERVHVFVSTRDADLQEEALREYCKQHLADFKVPDRFTLQSEPLPRNANGKVLKRQLADRAKQDNSGKLAG